jgi:drug/metabolite transporter (DMT)-like permease
VIFLVAAVALLCFNTFLHDSLLPMHPTSPHSFRYPHVAPFCAGCFTCLFVLIIALKTRRSLRSNPWRFLLVTIPQQLSAVCFCAARRHLDYSTLQLFNAATPLLIVCSQIALNSVLANPLQITVASLVSAGVLTFSVTASALPSLSGAALATAGLFFTSIYIPMVDRMRHGPGGPFVLVLYGHAWAVLLCALLHFGELAAAAIWIAGHPQFAPKVLLSGAAAALGNIAAFGSLAMSDGVAIALAVTLRRFCGSLSSALSRSQFGPLEWAGVALVGAALGIQAVRNATENRGDDGGLIKERAG